MTAAHLARFKKPIIISLKKNRSILAAVTQCY